MLFNSYPFIFIYLPVVLAGFFWLTPQSHRLAALWLAAASLFFYGWWNPAFVGLLLASIIFNYSAGYLIGHLREKGRSLPWLVGGLTINLLLLGYFKYANFFVENANGLGAGFTAIDIALPLGISFFTFTQIAFLIDVHRGIAREYNFVHYLLFVTWFPHLIAGPVLHHKQMMPQFAWPETFRPNAESMAVGLTLFALGLFKKVILADQFALYANSVFDGAAQGNAPMFFEAWIGALAYALQLYFDFSGYSDMAIGLSRLFNIRLPLNFDSPYKAANIIDFWRRWHMTLSRFLRDYLYIPLGGNRKGRLRRHLNLMATMLLGGLWHGAGWNFVLWGGLHGLYLVVNHGWRRLTGTQTTEARTRLGRFIGVALTFTAVVIAWVPFRAADFATVERMWWGMAGMNGVSLPTFLEPYLAQWLGHQVLFEGLQPGGGLGNAVKWSGVGLAIVWLLPNTQQWLAAFSPAWETVTAPASRWRFRPTRWVAVGVGGMFGISLLFLNRISEFLYFQF